MSNDAQEFVEAAIRRLDEELNRRNFRTVRAGELPRDWEWTGRVGPARETATVTLREGYPYSAPNVFLPDRADTGGWHTAPGGLLCLWTENSQAPMPWLNVQTLIERVEEWIAAADAGWVEDMPQLDVEAYNLAHCAVVGGTRTRTCLLIDHWDDIAGGWFRASQPGSGGVMQLQVVKTSPPPASLPTSTGRRPRKKHKADRYLNGVAVELGALRGPVFSVGDVVDACHDHAQTIGRFLECGRPLLVAGRYARGGGRGLIGFWLERDAPLMHFTLAERADSQRRRAGWHASALREHSVAIIGAGSVGSYVTELLDRSGVGDISLHDRDMLLPGNLVRHAATPTFAGKLKTTAVRNSALLRDPKSPIAEEGPLTTLAEAVELLNSRDLVVDCTGSSIVWQMLQQAAKLTNRRFLHVAVVGHGQYGRVDVCPPLGDADPLPQDALHGSFQGEFETGCGDPVSPTPPTAVLETASMGARFAIKMLGGEDIPPAGESRALFKLPS
ncbi:ThiF family adenylyltransferase [Agilicoccus flavus]|uniref:ThiF family adenylyltransferase n=1 Tax=Agilicoccus flavus TaxID=2775968 RepID=UPI001CF676C7|nr:ThiF family adenylyltransferase [Agilicoccus flavus]